MDEIELFQSPSQAGSPEDFKGFEDFITSELTNNTIDKYIFDDSDTEEDDNNFDYDAFSANFDEEAHNFIDGPSTSNIFYPNIKALEKHLFNNNASKSLKTSLRNSLQCQIDQEDRMEFFGILSPPPPQQQMDFSSEDGPSCSTKNPLQPSCISPDLFSTSSTEDEEEKVSNFQVELIEPVKEIVCHNLTRNKTANLIANAEKFMIKLLKDLVNDGTASITVVNYRSWENSEISNGILSQKDPSNLIHRNVNLSNTKSRPHFAMIMYVLSEVYHLLVTGLTCTERELYYKDPDLFKNQAAINFAVKDVCSILNASPWELGIRQSSKGLIAGAINIHMSDNSVINCYFNDRPNLIPNDIQAITFLETTAKFVLIVEKDTIFQKFLQQNILRNLNSDIILITGKGYPDVGTRLMVKRIWDYFHLPIYALVDADPFGIDIMFVYRYGSKAMAFSADQLACPQIRWIGIQPSEIEKLAIPTLAQSKTDKKKINELLQRTYINAEIRNELEILQRLGRKAEIEAVAGFSANFLAYEYIPNKIARNLVI
ncbi:meiotic recombination protein W68 [Episyrphus balteatus]|uniref:meiotic recombination protein W68 n=1 Tax=Episyrphus balteatus TaxID=286459 RepID=UPI002485856F|nr:meiotic recombination protein W68 [Episyrphus balteatus]